MRGVLVLGVLALVVLTDVVEAADDALRTETEAVLLALATEPAGPDYGNWQWQPDGQYRNPTLHDLGPSPRFEMELAIWQPAISGELAVGGGPFNVAIHLGVDTRQFTGAFNISGELQRFGLRFDGYLYAADGETTIRRSITIGDIVFERDEQAHSEIDLKNLRLLGTYSILGEGVFTLHGLLGASYYDLDMVVSSQPDKTAHVTATAALPVLGLALAYRWGRFRWEGEATGWYGDLGDFDGLLLDVTVSVSYTVDERVVLRAGYRRAYLDGRIGSVEVIGMTLEGLFLELGIRI